MQDKEVINILQNMLHFSSKSIEKLQIFTNALISANKKLNKYLIESNQKNFADLFYKLHFDISFSKNYLDNKKYQNEYYEMTKNLGYQTFKNQTSLILNRTNQLQN